MNLNELIKQYSLLENDEGQLCDDWQEKMDALGVTIEQKIDGICSIVKGCEGRAAAIETEIERLKKLKGRYEVKAKSLSTWLAYCIGAQKIDTGMHRVYARVSEAVDIIDEAMIPIQYIRETTKIVQTPDKESIKADLKLGAQIPGAALKKNISLVIK